MALGEESRERLENALSRLRPRGCESQLVLPLQLIHNLLPFISFPSASLDFDAMSNCRVTKAAIVSTGTCILHVVESGNLRPEF